jgi:hypothetical protein
MAWEIRVGESSTKSNQLEFKGRNKWRRENEDWYKLLVEHLIILSRAVEEWGRLEWDER